MDVRGTAGPAISALDRTRDVCRVCLSFDRSIRCIFARDPLDTLEAVDLSEKLRLCGGVEVGEGDGLPATICTACVSKLNEAHELRRQCQRADSKLRELYGKVRLGRGSAACARTKDRSCQTDYFFTPDSTKPETELPRSDEASDSNQRTFCEGVQEQRLDGGEYGNRFASQNGRVRRKQAGYEKVTAGREMYRTRMTTMFKHVTSMESLKNHKERQRQYIKKNTAGAKRESAEREFPGNLKSACHRMDGKSASRLPYVCPKCNGCYSSKRSFDKHVLTHDQRQFSCEKCNKQFFQLDKLLRHTKLHKSKENAKPVSCKICNKSFRKTDTMVRHLNAHKRVNPKEVLAILKEIRERRKLEVAEGEGEPEPEAEGEGEGEEAEDEGGAEAEGEEEGEAVSEANERRSWKGGPVVGGVDRAEEKRNEWNSNSDSNTDTTQAESEDPYLYRCNRCKKRYTTEKSLQRHALIHEEKKFVCNVCNMKFFRQDRLKSHKTRYGHDREQAELELELQKPSDDKSAIKLINSWIREELDSDNEEKGFPCNICGKSYDTKKSLLKHQVKAHEKQRGEESCASCRKTERCDCSGAVAGGGGGGGRGGAGKSKDREKVNEKSKPYRCEECDKCFEKEVKLQRHARIHERRAKEQQDADFKRFLCHICSKTFRQNTGLMFHMRTHTGYKPHVCKYCGRGFTSNSNCINHERTHTGDRPFVCHFCSAAFAKSCTLKAHITTHTGEANYHCKTCGKSFRRLKYLKEHRFTHTGEKPYACKICGTAYSHSGSLFVHEKKCKAQFTGHGYHQASGPPPGYGHGQGQGQGQGQSQGQSHSPQAAASPVLGRGPISVGGLAGQPAAALSPQNGNGNGYLDNIQRINASQCMAAVSSTASSSNLPTSASSELHVHPSPDVSDVSPPVRNFALIGQIFQS